MTDDTAVGQSSQGGVAAPPAPSSLPPASGQLFFTVGGGAGESKGIALPTMPAPVRAVRVAAAPNQAVVAQAPEVYRRIKSGAGWFYWIAGLSVLNSIIAAAGGSIHFVMGLGLTLVLDSVAKEIGGAALVLTLPICLLCAGLYVGLGYCAHRRMRWAFIVGMVLYGLDALLLLGVADFASVAFHALALYFILKGLLADSQARQLEAQEQLDAAGTSLPA